MFVEVPVLMIEYIYIDTVKMVYWRLLLFLSHTLITITTAQPNFRFSFCVPNPNNITTTYEANLKTLLSSFSSTINSYGFYTASHGQKSDRVNALGLCRGDVELDICRSCVNDSTHKLIQVCPNYTEAIAWYDYCMLSVLVQLSLSLCGCKMEPAKIDWKSINSVFVEDDLYDHINAPKWLYFSAPDQSVDDEAWFCRPDCNHLKTVEDFLKSTPPSKSSEWAGPPKWQRKIEGGP